MDWGFRHEDRLFPGVVASAVGYASSNITQSIHRGLPSPYLTFIVTFDQPVVGAFSSAEAVGPHAFRTDIIAAGLHTRPAYIRQPQEQSGVQLALYPLAARTLFGMPAAELAGVMTDADSVIGAEIDEVRERMAAADDWNARFLLLQGFLRQRAELPRRQAVRPEVAEAWRWLVRHQGAGSISGLADHVHLSPRQLHTVFDREFGIGPKSFNRLLRFQRTVQLITERAGAARELDLATVAADCGFADQPHLNRDFRAFTDLSPTGWVSEEIGNIRSGGHRNGDESGAAEKSKPFDVSVR